MAYNGGAMRAVLLAETFNNGNIADKQQNQIKMKRVVFALMVFSGMILCMSNSGCDKQSPTTNELLAEKQESLMQEANRQVGMPAIKNFQERKLMKMILELRDQEDLVCYAYLWNEYNGKLVFLGKCIGYGLPYATQYTNPETLETPGMSDRGCATMPQADPNGLFMPASADGTWLMMIDPESKDPRPVYIEPRVIVSPFKLL